MSKIKKIVANILESTALQWVAAMGLIAFTVLVVAVIVFLLWK